MTANPAAVPMSTGFELRFIDLFNRGHAFAFPCDAQGHVDMEGLSERALSNYLFARAVVGQQLSRPCVMPIER